MVLNHITRVAFLPLLALSPAGSGSFLFYLFRLSTAAVLEVRRDFAAIYFMRVTSFSALSLPPTVPRTTSYPNHLFPKTHPRDVLTELDSVRHTRTRERVCACIPCNDVFVSIAKAAPSVLFYTYFALIHPSRPLTASYHRPPNRLAFFSHVPRSSSR